MTYEIPVLTLVARVERFIQKNPGCTTGDMMEEFGIPQNVANTSAQRLRDNGKVRRVKVPGIRAATWWPGRDETIKTRDEDMKVRGGGQRDMGMKRIMVSEWEPCTVRDPLLWLSYGVNPQPVQESLL